LRIGVDEGYWPVAFKSGADRQVRGYRRLADAAFLARNDDDEHLRRSRRQFAGRPAVSPEAADQPLNGVIGRRCLRFIVD